MDVSPTLEGAIVEAFFRNVQSLDYRLREIMVTEVDLEIDFDESDRSHMLRLIQDWLQRLSYTFPDILLSRLSEDESFRGVASAIQEASHRMASVSKQLAELDDKATARHGKSVFQSCSRELHAVESLLSKVVGEFFEDASVDLQITGAKRTVSVHAATNKKTG